MEQDVTGCSVKTFCRNNEIRCWVCRAENPSCGEMFYKSNGDPKAPKVHPMVQSEKDIKKKEAKLDKAKKASANKQVKSKQTLAAMMENKAQKMAEKVMEKQIKRDFASPTLNSGRVNRDVDHTMHKGEIRLDSKHQSKRLNPQVDLKELEDAIYKANKFRSDLGGLILWNKDHRPVVVFDYEDWLQWESRRKTDIQENPKEY